MVRKYMGAGRTAILIKDVEFHWVYLDEPVTPFGTAIWEMTIVAPHSLAAKQWQKEGLRVKFWNGKFHASLKRNVYSGNGYENKPVRVVDSEKKPFDKVKNIGNGSRGNVIVLQYAYENKAEMGRAVVLDAVQVMKFVHYDPSNGADDCIDMFPTKRK